MSGCLSRLFGELVEGGAIHKSSFDLNSPDFDKLSLTSQLLNIFQSQLKTKQPWTFKIYLFIIGGYSY
jgi:hypothetical protein